MIRWNLRDQYLSIRADHFRSTQDLKIILFKLRVLNGKFHSVLKISRFLDRVMKKYEQE